MTRLPMLVAGGPYHSVSVFVMSPSIALHCNLCSSNLAVVL